MPEPRVTAAMCAHGRTVAEPRLSPRGDRLAFLATEGGRGRIVVVDGDGGPERVVTTDPPPCPSRAYGGGAFDWLPDGSGLVYAATDGGIWRQPASGGPPALLARHDRVSAPAVSPDGRRVAYVVDTQHVAVAPTEPDEGWPVRLTAGADFALDPCWSPDGQRLAWHEWDVPAMPWDASRIVERPADGSAPAVVRAGGDGVSVQQPRYGPDGRLAWLDDSSGWLNVRAGDGSAALPADDCEHGEPSWGPGQRSFAWSPAGDSIAHTRNLSGFGELAVVDVASGERRVVGRGVHGGLSWEAGRLVAVRSGARTPTSIVVYEGADLSRRRTVAVGPVAGFDDLIDEPEVVTWEGEDGTTVPGRLYRPAHRGLGEPPPLICWVHGGPTGQWPVTFNPRIAYWVDRGWAVLVPDHRGSTGHGRAFTQALAGRWGEADTADVAAGLRAAGERGWGHARKLAVMGGSAGGFTVLNVLAEHPGLCAAGVDLYGVADLLDLDETTHRFERHYLHSVVGPLPEAAGRYRRRSPVNRAGAITDPLLILQGADDEVVPPAQSRAIAERIRAAGGVVELHEYEGEGHGWGRPETVIDELKRTESFLRRHVLRWREP